MELIRESWIEVSVALNNKAHGDDQLGYHVSKDVSLLAVADGVFQIAWWVVSPQPCSFIIYNQYF